jgi:predicted metal-dependent phosphoesterase TrpH
MNRPANAPVDLHTHTTASDGTDSPAAVVEKAAKAGLAAVAVTDHDTISGLAEAGRAGETFDIAVVRGCELAVSSPYGEIHLLGLWLPEKMPRLSRFLEDIRESRGARNKEMVEKFRRAGFNITYPELLAAAEGETVGRPHMAKLLVQKGVCSSVRDAFNRYLGDDKEMYVPRVILSPEEGLALLCEEGAVTVFAHPMLLKAPPEAMERIVDSLAANGLDAIEAYHSEHDAKAVRRAESLARRYNLAVSGGSDYHGETRPDVALGTGKGDLYVPFTVYESLLEISRKKIKRYHTDFIRYFL